MNTTVTQPRALTLIQEAMPLADELGQAFRFQVNRFEADFSNQHSGDLALDMVAYGRDLTRDFDVDSYTKPRRAVVRAQVAALLMRAAAEILTPA